MAKLTIEEITEMSITRATFSNGNWTVIVMTPENKMYVTRFAGLETDTNEIVLSNTHAQLLTMEKQVPPVLPVTITREDICGQAPKCHHDLD